MERTGISNPKQAVCQRSCHEEGSFSRVCYLKWRRDNKPDWRTGDNTLEATLKTTKHIVF